MKISLRIIICALIIVQILTLQTTSGDKASATPIHFSLVLPPNLKSLSIVQERNGNALNDLLTKIHFTYFSDDNKTYQGRRHGGNPYPRHLPIPASNESLQSSMQTLSAKPALNIVKSRGVRHSRSLLPNQDAARQDPLQHFRETLLKIENTLGGDKVAGNDKTARGEASLNTYIENISKSNIGNTSHESYHNQDSSAYIAYENMQPVQQNSRKDMIPLQSNEEFGAVSSGNFDKYNKQLISGQTSNMISQTTKFDGAPSGNFYEKFRFSRNVVKNENNLGKKRGDSLISNIDQMNTKQTAKPTFLKQSRPAKYNVQLKRRARSGDEEWQGGGNAENNMRNRHLGLVRYPDYYYEYFTEYDDFPDVPTHPHMNRQKMTTNDMKQMKPLEISGRQSFFDSNLDVEDKKYPGMSVSSDQGKRLPLCIECHSVSANSPPLQPVNHKLFALETNRFNIFKPIQTSVSSSWNLKKSLGRNDVTPNEINAVDANEQNSVAVAYPDLVQGTRSEYKDLNEEIQKDIENPEFPVMQSESQAQQLDPRPEIRSSETISDNVRDQKLSAFLEDETTGDRRVHGQAISNPAPAAFQNVVAPQRYSNLNSYFKKILLHKNPDKTTFYNMPLAIHKMQHGIVSNSMLESSEVYRPITGKEKSSRITTSTNRRSGEPQSLPMREMKENRKFGSGESAASRTDNSREEVQPEPLEFDKNTNVNAAIDHSMHKQDTVHAQHFSPENYMYNTKLHSNEYYEENPPAQLKPSNVDYDNGQEGLNKLLPYKSYNADPNLDFKGMSEEDEQLEGKMTQELVPYRYGISRKPRRKRSFSFHKLNSTNLSQLLMDRAHGINVSRNPLFNSSKVSQEKVLQGPLNFLEGKFFEFVRDIYRTSNGLKIPSGFNACQRPSRKLSGPNATALCRSSESLLNAGLFISGKNESWISDVRNSHPGLLFMNLTTTQNDIPNNSTFYRIKFPGSARVITVLKIKSGHGAYDKRESARLRIQYKDRVCKERQLKVLMKQQLYTFDAPIVAFQLDVYQQERTGQFILLLDILGCPYKGHSSEKVTRCSQNDGD